MGKKNRRRNDDAQPIVSDFAAEHKPHPRTLKEVVPRNPKQEEYLQAVRDNIVTISAGPAGSGKTYLAVYEALRHHWAKMGMKRLIISRPAIEAGEKLGFLPGTMEEKVDPYMRPIYDALYDIMGIALTKEKMERGYIEVAPLGFLRGRTFNNSFIILDEAQNATYEQLKMAITRVGENCKMIINGDPQQTDLPRTQQNGLNRLIDVVSGVENIAVIKFDSGHVVRSKIVADLVAAFEKHEDGSP